MYMAVLRWIVLVALALGVVSGCASKGRLEYATLGSVEYPIVKVVALWEVTVTVPLLDMFLDGLLVGPPAPVSGAVE